MSSFGSPSPFFLAGKKAYEVERSLRFNAGDSPYFNRTPSSAGNRRTWTLSFWVKRGSLTSNMGIFGAETGSGSESGDRLTIMFGNAGSDQARFYSQSPAAEVYTNRLFRDVSSWYHIVWAVDTTQATASNRIKLYVNGTQETSFASASYPSQNSDLTVNNTTVQYIGRNSGYDGEYFDGYIAEMNLIDGQQYDSSYFGETNATTGQWIPKQYTGSYGTNGFYLNFSDNSGTTATTLGKDSSGNGNNFTPNNFSVSAGAGNDSLEDTPTNNFCTLNAIALGQGNEQRATLSNGNLDFTESSSSNRTAVSTFGLKTGKWYFEFLSTNTGTFSIGWHDMENNQGSFYRNNGSYSSSFGGGGTSGYASWTTNDIVGVAIDFDSGKIWYAKNNTWQSGDPATGNSPTNTFTTGRTLHTEAFTDNSSGTKSGSFNFGQRAFSYTPPTGYKSICSANLPDPTIKLPNNHFGTLLWTGNATVRTISDTSAVNFTPDWVWVKSRSSGDDHQLTDSVRGSSKALKSNATDAEIDWDTAYSGNNKGMGDYVNGGFILDDNGNNNRYNRNSATFVAWNWNGGDTDGKTYTVKVVSDSGNKYRFDDFGTSAVTLDLAEGGTYTFDQSDSSMSSHPMQLSTTANGTHGGGSAYSTGVTYELDGSTVTASAFISGFSSASSRKLIITVAASAPNLNYYCYYHSGMGGAINTNSTLGSSNFDGTIQSVAKVNTTAGFSIVTYTGNGTGGATIGHGLGVTPNVFFVKNRGTGARIWLVYHGANTSEPATEYLQLDGTAATADDNSAWNDTAPTSTVFSVGTSASSNNNGEGHVAYCFSEVAGYSKFGKYTGNGSSDGTFVFTGFKIAVLIVKQSTGTNNWHIMDNRRDIDNPLGNLLLPNTSDAENTVSANRFDFLSNGFKCRDTSGGTNSSGQTYIYLAFAEAPFRNARAR
jgi:hypothetical protein